MLHDSAHASPSMPQSMRSGLNGSLTYKDYVKALCHRHPSLLTLSRFLSNPKARHQGCRVAAIDFRQKVSQPITRHLPDVDCLLSEIHGKADRDHNGESDPYDHPLQGRILVIEDLTVDVIELLGSELDVDPLFFAMHLHSVQRIATRHQIPDEAALPSRIRSKDYINLSYQRPILCESIGSGEKWIRNSAVDRKLVLLRSTTLALAAHCASVINVWGSNGVWIALILVDPPLGDTHFRYGYKDSEEHKVKLNLRPFLGPYEDFLDPPMYTEDWSHLIDKPRYSLLEDILDYWNRGTPACFDQENPTIQALAYYPLRIVAAEWVKYVEVMQHCIKLYQYNNTQIPALDKINHDLRELQGWRLRSLNSQQKLGSVIRKLKAQYASDSSPKSRESMAPIIEDYEVILSNMQGACARLEKMLPVVTSLVQIIDARQSFAETANISRLTILALVFVPLSYISSVFSMNPANLPGADRFWVYLAVAIPVTILVIVLARPPVATMRRILAWLRGTKKRKNDPESTR